MSMIFSDEIVSVSSLRRQLPVYLEKARNGCPISIMQGKQADVALVRRDAVAQLASELELLRKQVSYLQSWVETREILADPETMDKIRRSEEDIAANRGYTPEEIKTMFGL